MYRVEKLPIPLKAKYPFSTMEVGDSFWRSTKDLGKRKNLHQSKMSMAMRQYAKTSGKKFKASVGYEGLNGKLALGMRFSRVS